MQTSQTFLTSAASNTQPAIQQFLTSLHKTSLELTCDLLRYPSVTPWDGGCLHHLHALLQREGFDSQHFVFDDTTNLYARWGTGQPHLCFAGHVDVVPAGFRELWTFDPFEPTVRDGILYGRGAADMKGAIACFLTAMMTLIERARQKKTKFAGSISLLLTSDEEGTGVNGIQRMIPWMRQNGQVPDVILIGEPTGEKTGQVLQVGRRGSITGRLKSMGKQGHIAYPHLADNPLPRLIRCLSDLMDQQFDQGNAFFQPSHLEVTSVDTGNPTTNVIPQEAYARFGIRFNSLHKASELSAAVSHVCQKTLGHKHQLALQHHGDPFYIQDEKWLACVHGAMKSVTGQDPVHTTQGGTTDGRFLTHLAPVLEVGLPETTIHQIDEHVAVQDLQALETLYGAILRAYFHSA